MPALLANLLGAYKTELVKFIETAQLPSKLLSAEPLLPGEFHKFTSFNTSRYVEQFHPQDNPWHSNTRDSHPTPQHGYS